jgi:hypothetical protein
LSMDVRTICINIFKRHIWLFFVGLLMWRGLIACTSVTTTESSNEADKSEFARNLIVEITGDNGQFGAGIIFGMTQDMVLIATANHVVRPTGMEAINNLKVLFNFWRLNPVKAQLSERYDKDLDLAIVYVNIRDSELSFETLKSKLPFAHIAYSDKQLVPGAEVYPLGHPDGELWYIPMTSIPKVLGTIGNKIRLDYPCYRGQSGGGVFDKHWNLVGMILDTSGPKSEAVNFKSIREALVFWNLEVHLVPEGTTPPKLSQQAKLKNASTPTPKPTITPTAMPSSSPTPIATVTVIAIKKLPLIVTPDTTFTNDRPGSCKHVEFPINPDGKADWPYPVKVLRQDTPVYQDPTSSALNPSQDKLAFNQSLSILNVQEKRVEVRSLGAPKSLGWVDRTNLLCTLKPLKGASGLEKKFYIRTATDIRKEKPATVNVYPSPDLQGCTGEECRGLSRFTWYFVFDETEQSYLLSDSLRINETSPLVGWIAKQDGFVWDTAYGIRPKEEPDDQIVCFYTNLEDALAKQNCYPILGGTRWYLSSVRIPVVERIQAAGKAFYDVVLPLPNIIIEYNEKQGEIKLRLDQTNDANQLNEIGKKILQGESLVNLIGSQENTEQDNSGFPFPYNTLVEGYIPISSDIVEDVALTSKDLENWIMILNAIGDMTMVSGTELREYFVQAIRDALEKVIRKPLYEDIDEPLVIFLQRQGGLPVRDDSPLFRYSLHDLRDPLQVPDCELGRLVTWVSIAAEILGIVSHGDMCPKYNTIPYPGECPSGSNIPFIDGAITAEKLGNDPNMRYDYVFQNAHIYWVPKEFLP